MLYYTMKVGAPNSFSSWMYLLAPPVPRHFTLKRMHVYNYIMSIMYSMQHVWMSGIKINPALIDQHLFFLLLLR